jgi:hypothetical protein
MMMIMMMMMIIIIIGLSKYFKNDQINGVR